MFACTMIKVFASVTVAVWILSTCSNATVVKEDQKGKLWIFLYCEKLQIIVFFQNGIGGVYNMNVGIFPALGMVCWNTSHIILLLPSVV